MHVKINIPPERGQHSRGCGYPDLKQPNKHYLVPLSSICLKEHESTYTGIEYDQLARRSYEQTKTITRYWLRCPEVSIVEWAEIHYAEYARLSGLMKKLNLIEVDEHNKRALHVGATECVISRSDIRAFYRDNINEQLEELEDELGRDGDT